MLCEVQRSFGGADNKPLEVGAVIDVSDWPPKRVHNLIERRYLKEVREELATASQSRRGRRGADAPQEE